MTAPAAAQAADSYVDADTGSGTSCTMVSPCATVLLGVGAAGTNDDVFVDGDTYVEFISFGDGKSLIAQEFVGAADGPAVLDGGAGAALAIGPSGAGTISGFTIRGDSQSIDIGGAATVIGNTFDEDVPALIDQADMRISGSSADPVTISDNTFTDPTPTDDQTAIIGLGAPQPLIEDNTFIGFRETVDVDGGNVELSGNEVVGAHSAGAIDGVGFAFSDGTANIHDNVIRPPVVGSVLGMRISDSDPGTAPHTGATLRRNQVFDLERGIEVSDTPSPVTLDGDVIAGNVDGLRAEDGDFTGTEGDTTVTNVTFFDNTSSDILADEVAMTVDSTITEAGVDTDSSAATCTITSSRGPTTTPGGDGCANFQTTAVPTFVNAAANDYHMTSASPLIDLGNPLAPAPGAVDLDGDARALDGNCDGIVRRDIGADELPCTPVAPGDKDPPETSIIKKPGKKIESDKTTIKFSSDEPGSTFQCQLDKKPFSPCSSPRRLRKLSPGKHKFQARAVDPSGNVDPSPVGVKFRVAKPK